MKRPEEEIIKSSNEKQEISSTEEWGNITLYKKALLFALEALKSCGTYYGDPWGRDTVAVFVGMLRIFLGEPVQSMEPIKREEK